MSKGDIGGVKMRDPEVWSDQDIQRIWEDILFDNPNIPPLEVFLKAKVEGRLEAVMYLAYGKLVITGEDAGIWEWEE